MSLMSLGALYAPYALEWAQWLLRWAHVVVAIAWIGSSFYFVWLDNSLMVPDDDALKAQGVGGHLWAVHGGGFYNPQKYLGAPPRLPHSLHWFYWESYSTWLTGFALFTVLYLFNAGAFLIDPAVHAWRPAQAVGLALACLAGFWAAYHALCLTLGTRHGRHPAVLGGAVLALVVLAAWLACQWFAGRAAFLLVGAMLATAMSANVFFVIIPGQRKVVASMAAGQPVDPEHGLRGKQRSVHNTYFTLPVLAAMLSNHVGWATGHRHNWAVLVGLMLSGALIRHFFVARHRTLLRGQPSPWGWAAAGVGLLLALGVWMAPPVDGLRPAEAEPHASPEQHAAAAFRVVQQRCVACHNGPLAAKGVRLDTPARLAEKAQAVYQQAVVLRAMPMNNATGITEAERAVLKRWFEQGASAHPPVNGR